MTRILCLGALLAVLPSCASSDGVSTSFDANPVTALPVVNQIAPVRDAAVDTTATVAADLMDIALEPIRFFFQASEPGYRFDAPDPQRVRPVTPDERQSIRRTQMGLPPSAESRIEARRSLIRTRMGMGN